MALYKLLLHVSLEKMRTIICMFALLLLYEYNVLAGCFLRSLFLGSLHSVCECVPDRGWIADRKNEF